MQKARQLAGVSGNLCILGKKDTDRGGLVEALFNASARSGEPLMELDVSLLSPESARAYLIGQEDIHGVTRGILELANGGGVTCGITGRHPRRCRVSSKRLRRASAFCV